jgi:hypothetical protein
VNTTLARLANISSVISMHDGATIRWSFGRDFPELPHSPKLLKPVSMLAGFRVKVLRTRTREFFVDSAGHKTFGRTCASICHSLQ